MKQLELLVVRTQDMSEFAKECNQYLEAGFTLVSSSCGFMNSEEYDFQDIWQAIFVRDLRIEKGK